AALWDSVVRLAMEPPGRWGTVLNMTRRVLGEWEEEEWPTTDALRATVTAAHIAASRRDSALFDARGAWETVRTWADRHPDRVSGRRLLQRAALGLLPYAPEDDSLWAPGAAVSSLAGETDQALESDELRAAFVDCAHRLLEAGQGRVVRRLYPGLPGLPVRGDDSRVAVWEAVVVARLVADIDRGAGRDWLEHAEQEATEASDGGPSLAEG